MGTYEPPLWDSYEQDESEESHTFQGAIKYQTDKAYLVELTFSDEEHWIPKSQVLDLDGELIEGKPIVGEVYQFTIPSWLADKKGF